MNRSSIGAAMGCAFVFSLLLAESSNAATVVNSFDNGWYSQANNSSSDFTAGVSNINVGWNSVTGATYRNWLAFDLSALTGKKVASATLIFYGNNGVYASPKQSETLGLFAYGGSINSLLAGHTGVGIYNDLGTGADYGSTAVSQGYGQISISLTAAAISALNAALNDPNDQRFVIGGALTSIALIHDGSNWYSDGQLFRINGPTPALDQAAFLNLNVSEVPLPAALPLFASALIGGGVIAWRKRREQKAEPLAA
jgi:hypothetical protein